MLVVVQETHDRAGVWEGILSSCLRKLGSVDVHSGRKDKLAVEKELWPVVLGFEVDEIVKCSISRQKPALGFFI